MFGGKSQKAVCRSAWAVAGEPPRFSGTPGGGGRGAHPETLNETAPTYQRAPWMIGREARRLLPLLHDTAYTALKLHKLPAEQCRNTVKSMRYSAKCRLCRICKLIKTIENTSFLRNCMNMHSIQRRKRPQKLHQYAPDHRHITSRNSPTIFLSDATTHILLGYKIIISSYHRITASPSRSQDSTPRKEGGTIGGVIYIAQ